MTPHSTDMPSIDTDMEPVRDPSQKPGEDGEATRPGTPRGMRFQILKFWERVALGSYFALNCALLVIRSKIALRFWWYGRQGRQDKVEAKVAGITKGWARDMLVHFRCSVEVTGVEHVPLEGPLIVVCNHQSFYDIPLLMGYIGRPIGFVLKRTLFAIPGLAYWMRRMHCLALDRSDPRAASRLFQQWGTEIVENNRCIVIFPEGTRTRHPDRELGPFRRGSLRLAERFGIPILPVTLDGTQFITKHDLMAATRTGGRVVRMRIGPPITTKTSSAPEAKQFADELRAQMVAQWESIRVEWPVERSPDHAPRQPIQ